MGKNFSIYILVLCLFVSVVVILHCFMYEKSVSFPTCNSVAMWQIVSFIDNVLTAFF